MSWRSGIVVFSGTVLIAALALANRTGTTAAAQTLPPTDVNPSLGWLPQAQVAGNAQPPKSVNTPDPYSGNASAIAEGGRLFVAMNCAGCHGYDATGGMGPDLTDKNWRHGGAPASVYDSIAEGRSQGMPAWGGVLPPQAIWSLVAYLESLGGMFPPSGYSASLQGDRDNMLVAPGTTTMDEITSGSGAPAATTPSGDSGSPDDAARRLTFGPRS